MKKLIRIAKKYDAIAVVRGKTALIYYRVLGQGSAISGDIEAVFDAVRIKMTPSEQKLEVMVL